MEIKLGNWLLINKDIDIDLKYISHTIRGIQKDQLPLYFYNKNVDPATKLTTVRAVLKDILGVNYSVISLPEDYFGIITEEEAKKRIEKINKNKRKQLENQLKELKTKRLPIDKKRIIDYDIPSKQFLNCKNSFVKTVPKSLKINNTTSKEIKNGGQVSEGFFVECCSFTKISRDLLVYVPKTWLEHYGYNILDLKSYISFLKKCDINFEAEILGAVDLWKAFSRVPSKMMLSKGANFIKENEIGYEILIKGKSPYVTYFHFLLLRYICNSQYWNIPFITMKLKKNMPKATNWQCLLLAHNAHNYNAYYSLAPITSTAVLFNGNKTKRNSPERVLKTMQEVGYVNQSFYLGVNPTEMTIRTAILNENYEFLQKFLNEN